MKKYILKSIVFLAILVMIIGFSVIPTNTVKAAETTITGNSSGTVSASSDVYILPLLNSSKIGTLNSGETILIISVTSNWAYVQTDSITGWIFLKNIQGAETATSENVTENEVVENEVTNEEENTVNEVAEVNETVESTVDTNTAVNETTSTTTNETSSSATTSTSSKVMYVNVEAVYIREEASTSSSIVASVGLNTPVTVTGESGDWYQVKVSDGSGYMMKQYLSESKVEE